MNAADCTGALGRRPAGRGLVTGGGEALIFLYLVSSAFIYYLPSVPGTGVNPVNVIAVMIYIVAGVKGVRRQGTGLTNASLAYWLLTATGLASCFANDPLEVFHEICVLLTFVSFVVILGSRDTRVSFQGWMRVLMIVGVAQGITAIAIYWMWIPAPELAGLHSFNRERTGYIIDGFFGVLSVLAGLWSLSAYRGRWSFVLALAATVLGVANAILSGYRSYAVGSGFLLVVFAIWTAVRRDWRFVAIQAAITAGMALAAAVDPTGRINAMHQRVMGVRDYDPSLTWRQLESEQERYLIRGNPWIGGGWGLSKRMRVVYIGDMPSYGHNFYTALPARVGIPLTVYLSVSWLLAAVSGMRRLRGVDRGDHVSAAVCWYGIAAVATVFGVSLVQNVALMSRAFPGFSFFVVPLLMVRRPAKDILTFLNSDSMRVRYAGL